MEEPTVYIPVTEEELWLIRSVVRHEVPQMGSWKFPPADLDLNKEIALLIAAGGDGILELTETTCRILDYTIPQDARDKDGRPIGKDLLRKVCVAMRDLALGYPDTEEPRAPSKEEIVARLKEDKGYGNTDNNPNDDSDYRTLPGAMAGTLDRPGPDLSPAGP